jgi:hypothetical protein
MEKRNLTTHATVEIIANINGTVAAKKRISWPAYLVIDHAKRLCVPNAIDLDQIVSNNGVPKKEGSVSPPRDIGQTLKLLPTL